MERSNDEAIGAMCGKSDTDPYADRYHVRMMDPLEREMKSGERDDYRPYDGKYDSPERKPHGKSGYRPIAVVWPLVFFFIHSFPLLRDFTTTPAWREVRAQGRKKQAIKNPPKRV